MSFYFISFDISFSVGRQIIMEKIKVLKEKVSTQVKITLAIKYKGKFSL